MESRAFCLFLLLGGTIISNVAATTASAEGAPLSIQSEGSWVEEKGRGWFFYNEEKEPEKKEPKKEKKEPPSPPPPPPAPLPDFTKKESKPSPKGPEPFSAEWFRKNLPKYKDRAWDNPTPENIRTYFTLQKIVLDRAERFANVAQEVVIGDPLLDESTNRPLSMAASRSHDMAAQKAERALLKAISPKFGVVFIFNGERCKGDCLLAAQNVKKLQTQFGFETLAISTDGQTFPGNPFEQFMTDKKAPKRLRLVNYPAIALIDRQTREIVPVAQYAMALSEMRRTILLAAKKRGYIDEQQWNKTKKYAPVLHADKREVLEMLKKKAGQHAGKDGFIPPEALYPYIKNLNPDISALMVGNEK